MPAVFVAKDVIAALHLANELCKGAKEFLTTRAKAKEIKAAELKETEAKNAREKVEKQTLLDQVAALVAQAADMQKQAADMQRRVDLLENARKAQSRPTPYHPTVPTGAQN